MAALIGLPSDTFGEVQVADNQQVVWLVRQAYDDSLSPNARRVPSFRLELVGPMKRERRPITRPRPQRGSMLPSCTAIL